MLARLIALSVIVVSTPLSILLLWLWGLLAWAILFTGGLHEELNELYLDAFVQLNFARVLVVGRTLIGVFGGFIGWISLVALAFMSTRQYSLIPRWIKVGCLVGTVSALVIPAATVMALPPILLCIAMFWLAHKRET